MKKILLTAMLSIGSILYGQVGIGTSQPHNSAILDLTATDKGFLPPRLTINQRDSISVLTAGLTIYNLDLNCIQYWNTAKWVGNCETSPIGEGTITTLDCPGSVNTGVLTAGQLASGVSSDIGYTGGNGGSYPQQNIASSTTGVTGLTASIASGNLANGNGTLTYNITGTPSHAGIAYFLININGVSCTLERIVTSDLTATCSGFMLPWSNNGGSITGLVNGQSITATFNNYNNVDNGATTGRCGLSINSNNNFRIGWRTWVQPTDPPMPASMKITFNKKITNLKMTQTFSNDYRFTYIFRNAGVRVYPQLILSSVAGCSDKVSVNQSASTITHISSADINTAVVFNAEGAWFDEIEISTNGANTQNGPGGTFTPNGSSMQFCIGTVQ